ncbi:MAG: glutaredoxin family protein [Deltaproteobacteria bacterium]
MAQVKVFSTPTCPYCIKVKDYLKEKGVAFTAVDVAGDRAALEEMMRVSGQMGVPVILVDNDVIVGFDRERLNEKLGL